MNRSPGMRSWRCRALVGVACGAAALGAPYAAQAQGYISTSPSVVVDLGVLDSLGPARATTLLPRSSVPVAAPTASVSTENLPDPPSLLDPPPSAPISRLNVPVPTPPTRPVRPPVAPTIAAAAAELPKPPAAVPRAAPAVQTAARPPVPEKPTVALPPVATPQAIAPRAVTPPTSRAALREATQVPPPPRPPEVPAVTIQTPAPTARKSAPPVVEPPSVEVLQPPTTPQVAARPDPSEEYELRLEFESGSARLPDDGRQPLQKLVDQLGGDADTRLQLRAYAGGTAETSSLARRLSLSRALAVRSYLIEQGVRSTRMDVRALGNKSGEGPPDRVDIVLVDR